VLQELPLDTFGQLLVLFPPFPHLETGTQDMKGEGVVILCSDADLEELSHETEMGCWWYGWTEPYLEINL
jgi:hypothetical protein